MAKFDIDIKKAFMEGLKKYEVEVIEKNGHIPELKKVGNVTFPSDPGKLTMKEFQFIVNYGQEMNLLFKDIYQ